MTALTAPWAAPDYAAYLAAQLAAMPVLFVSSVFVRDSQGRRWAVLRLTPHTWQISLDGMLYVRDLAGAVAVMEA